MAVMQLDDQSSYNLYEENSLLMTEAGDAFVRND